MTSTAIQQLAEQAMQLFKDDEFEQAAALFQQAAEKYQESGEANLAAEARNNQSVALLQAGNPARCIKRSAWD